MKHHDQKQHGKKGLTGLNTLNHSPPRDTNIEFKPSGNLEAGAGAGAMEGAAYSLDFMASSAYFLLKTRTTSLGITAHKGWFLPHQSVIRTMLYRLAYRPISQRHFLNWGSLLRCLCQVDIKLVSRSKFLQVALNCQSPRGAFDVNDLLWEVLTPVYPVHCCIPFFRLGPDRNTCFFFFFFFQLHPLKFSVEDNMVIKVKTGQAA